MSTIYQPLSLARAKACSIATSSARNIDSTSTREEILGSLTKHSMQWHQYHIGSAYTSKCSRQLTSLLV